MRADRTSLVLAAAAVHFCACATSEETITAEEQKRMTITLRSSAFVEGGMIPKQFTCDGKGVSPPLSWSNVPKEAQSLALICQDPDAPLGTFSHWVLYHVPLGVSELSEAIPADGEVVLEGAGTTRARQGKNDFDKIGYGGPCPPRGTHRYQFRLYALDDLPALEPGVIRVDLLKLMKGHILAEGQLTGKYAR
jgi:Raf kinase inhibitor-like YbhB/YbcL family protein